MTVTISELTSSYSSTDGASYTTASVSPSANSLLIVCWSTRRSVADPPAVPSISGLSLTWFDITDQVDGVSRLGSAWAQCGASPGSGTITLSLSGVDHLGCAWHVLQVTGHNQSDPIQATGAAATGLTATSGSVTMGTRSNASNALVGHFMIRANETLNAEGGWTAGTNRAGSSPVHGQRVEWLSGGSDVTPSMTWTSSVRWQGLAFEVRDAGDTAGVAWFDGVTVAVEVGFADGPLAAAPTWTDITDYVRWLSTSRGRSTELSQYNAGTASVVLSNRDRRFDPTYTSGPYYGQLLPMRQLRISATYDGTTYRLFRGHVQGWPQESYANRDGTVTVEAVDAFGWLGAVEVGRSASHAAARGHSGLVGFWPMTVASSSADPVAELDLSGYTGPQLVLTGNPGLVADPVASAHTVTPAESTLVALKDGLGYTPLTSTTNRTLECWVYLGDAEYNASSGITVYFAGDENLWLSIVPAWQDLGTDLVTGWAIYGGYNTAAVGGTGTYYEVLTAGQGYTNPGAHYVAVTFDADAGSLTLVIDNASQSDSAGTGSTVSDNASGLLDDGFAGVYMAGGSYLTTDVWVSNVAAYSTPLSVAELQEHYEVGLTGGRLDTTAERIGRVLDAVAWPDALRDVDSGDSYCGTWQPDGVYALPALQQLEATEQGKLFVAGDGTLTLRARTWALTAAAAITEQWTASETHYADVTVDGVSRDQIRNRCTVSGAFGSVTSSDATSIANYGTLDDSLTVDLADATAGVTLADWRLWLYGQPSNRLTGMTIRPRRTPATLFPQVLGRELGERVAVQRTPQGVGSAATYTVTVEAIAHTVAASGEWITSWFLVPAPQAYDERTWWVVDVSTYNQVDQGHQVPF